MSYLMYIAIGALMVLVAGPERSYDSTTWICLAILTAGEVISWRGKK